MDPQSLDKPLEGLELNGLVGPPQLELVEFHGFMNRNNFNLFMSQLATDITALQTLKTEALRRQGENLTAVREQEAWLEDRRQEIDDRLARRNHDALDYGTEAALRPLSSVAYQPVSRECLTIWGHEADRSGPWRSVTAREQDSPWGPTIAGRWRLTYERPVIVSQLDLAVAPETLQVYNVYTSRVSAGSGQTVSVAGLSVTARQVQVDVLSGPSAGSWFLATLDGATLTGCAATLTYLDDLQIGLRCDVWDIGRGRYEIEYGGAPVSCERLDLVTGSTRQQATLGMPKVDSRYVIYEPARKLVSRNGGDPQREAILRTTTILPDGASISHRLIGGDGGQIAITANSLLTLSQLLPIRQIRQEVTLDRLRQADLWWAPVVPIDTSPYGFDPNLDGSRQTYTLIEQFGRGVGDAGEDPFHRWAQLGTVTQVGGGVGTSGISSATNPACSLVTSSAILLKPGYGQPYGTIYQWYLWAGLFGGTAGDALARMANNSHAEVRLREDHRGNALAIRTSPSDSSLYAGLYLYGNGSATTLATGGALPVSGPPYLYTVQIDPSSITVWVGTVTATAFSMTVTGVTIDFAGPGVSVWAHGGAVLVDALTVRSDLPHLAPVRVSVERDGTLVPPDRTGISVEELAPRYITVRVGPDRSNTGTYRLPYPPIRRLSSQTQAGEAAVEVYEWDEDNQVAGDQVNEFEIDIAASTLRIRDQVRGGPLQISYWSLARRDVDVPITRNVTRYFGNAPLTTLRPANLDIDSRGYYPIYEYRQRGRKLEFAEAHDHIFVDYDTYGVRLTVETTFLRGSNPCRSPRITRGHWESR